jgi:hypothetical protein
MFQSGSSSQSTSVLAFESDEASLPEVDGGLDDVSSFDSLGVDEMCRMSGV